MEKVVFLDRDGTINEEVNYLYRKEDFVLIPGVLKGLKALSKAGFKLVVVTNQAGVARGYYQEEDVMALHRYLNECLKEEGVWIDHFFYCPHHPQHGSSMYKKDCTCRKPGTGMLKMAEEYYEIDKEHSYMIGDNTGDIYSGVAFGVRSILVSTGHGAKVYEKVKEVCSFYAKDLFEGVQWILEREKESHGGTI